MNPKLWAILWSTDENQEVVMELLRQSTKLEAADLGRQTKIFNLFFENLVVRGAVLFVFLSMSFVKCVSDMSADTSAHHFAREAFGAPDDLLHSPAERVRRQALEVELNVYILFLFLIFVFSYVVGFSFS
jgi:hypothetical protein